MQITVHNIGLCPKRKVFNNSYVRQIQIELKKQTQPFGRVSENLSFEKN